MKTSLSLALMLGALLSTAPRLASAQVEAPQPLVLNEATYPAEALLTGHAARVLLQLTLDETGAVSEAQVAESAGEAFDASALAASRELRFTPAKNDGVPVACQILFAYDFAPPSAAPEPESESASSLPELPTLTTTVTASSAARRLQKSAQAVRVLETKIVKEQSSDLGEVLARTEGVGVRRGGGLGSNARFSLNGLSDDQVRFLLDGLPLDFSGYPFGLANVPVNLIERVEIYRGVVPVRFGADALGGAVHLVSDTRHRGSEGAASYQVGSFGTHRFTLSGRHQHQPTGLFLRASGFFDHATNDYPIDVEIPDERGKLAAHRVTRFHDAYQAYGARLEAGFTDKPWARRLLLTGFATNADKELQHNVVMTVPYGEVESARTSAGATLRWEHQPSEALSLELIGGYSYGRTLFLDQSECIYSWTGECIAQRVRPGEIDARARDQLLWQHSVLARVNAQWSASSTDTLRLSIAPSFVTRSGDDRSPAPANTRDPMTAIQELLTLVSGVEYEADLFGDRLENIAFVKHYAQWASSSELLPSGDTHLLSRDTTRFGFGDLLRFRITDELQAKASYEWATRLPRAEESFGDGVLIGANPTLQPETSHNLNLGLGLEIRSERAGLFRADANGFMRNASDLIVLLGGDTTFTYLNVLSARSLGVEGSVGWTSPRDFLALDANATWQDFRNVSSDGAFKHVSGDRIPNLPYLFANASARTQWRELFLSRDELSLGWTLRYVHEFFRGWESLGRRSTKQVIPTQLLQSLALTWALRGEPFEIAFTAEALNLTDAAAYDFFGAQKPGRAFFFKTTARF